MEGGICPKCGDFLSLPEVVEEFAFEEIHEMECQNCDYKKRVVFEKPLTI